MKIFYQFIYDTEKFYNSWRLLNQKRAFHIAVRLQWKIMFIGYDFQIENKSTTLGRFIKVNKKTALTMMTIYNIWILM